MKAGASEQSRDINEMTPMVNAATEGHKEIIKQIIKHGKTVVKKFLQISKVIPPKVRTVLRHNVTPWDKTRHMSPNIRRLKISILSENVKICQFFGFIKNKIFV